MDRVIVYAGEIPYEEDLLATNRFTMASIAKLAQAVLGTHTLVNGLACTPTAPASMEIQVAPGEIYSLQNLDESAYSSLPADIDHPILKQGVRWEAARFACGAPATSGQSLDYLVQAAYWDMDAEPAVLPYYDTAHPDHPYSGPNNSGEAQPTVRRGVCQVSVKAGVAAPSGHQHPPAPDAGYTGLYRITVTHGQTTITGHDIRLYPDAPFITETLTQKISQAQADKHYARKATTLAGYGITDAVNVKEKGQAGGVATLDKTGRVPPAQLPPLDITPPDGSINTSKLADGSVTAPKIAQGAVSESKIANQAVSKEKIVEGAVTEPKIANEAVSAAKLAPGAALANLGYTPVATEGNQQIRGQLTLNDQVNLFDPGNGSIRSVRNGGGELRLGPLDAHVVAILDDGRIWSSKYGFLDQAFVAATGHQQIHGALTLDYQVNLLDTGNGSLRSVRNAGNEWQFIDATGTVKFAVRDDGTVWTPGYGQLHDRFANKQELAGKANAGAECQHNSGIWEFASAPGWGESHTMDAPAPWMVVGMGIKGSFDDRGHWWYSYHMRAVKVRNQ